MKYERTITIWDINHLLYLFNNDRLVYVFDEINEKIIKEVLKNHSIGSLLLKCSIDEKDLLTYYEILNGEEQVSSIINYYIRNNLDKETKRTFCSYKFPVEIVYE